MRMDQQVYAQETQYKTGSTRQSRPYDSRRLKFIPFQNRRLEKHCYIDAKANHHTRCHMLKIKSFINKLVWGGAVSTALYRVLTGPNLGLSILECLMIAIAAFVTGKTLALVLPEESCSEKD